MSSVLCTYQLQAPPPPPGASGGDLSSSMCTIPHLWGYTFEANPHTRPSITQGILHAGETLYGVNKLFSLH